MLSGTCQSCTRCGACGWRIQEYDEVSSTNDLVKRALEMGAPEGTVVCATAQTGGYGRQGRAWASPEGGLYLSVLLRPDAPPAQLPTLSLAVGVAVRRAIASLASPACAPLVKVKWPNDVIYSACPGGASEAPATGSSAQAPAGSQQFRRRGAGDRACEQHDGHAHPRSCRLDQPVLFQKLCGISLEQHAGGICVGIGVNVQAPMRAQTVEGKNAAAYVTGISEHDVHPSDVRTAVLDALGEVYPHWLTDGFQAVAQEYAEHAALTGCKVTVQHVDGSPMSQGVVEGVDPFGRLLLRTEDGVIGLSSGEVHLTIS